MAAKENPLGTGAKLAIAAGVVGGAAAALYYATRPASTSSGALGATPSKLTLTRETLLKLGPQVCYADPNRDGVICFPAPRATEPGVTASGWVCANKV